MYANRRNFRVFYEIVVEKHDDDVRFFTGSGNTAVSLRGNASGHYYWNSSFIMDVAMGQIPIERISSLGISFYRATACNVTHGIVHHSVHPSVCLSVSQTRALCQNERNLCRVLIQH